MRDIVNTVGVWSGIVGTLIGLPTLGLTYWQVTKHAKRPLWHGRGVPVRGTSCSSIIVTALA